MVWVLCCCLCCCCCETDAYFVPISLASLGFTVPCLSSLHLQMSMRLNQFLILLFPPFAKNVIINHSSHFFLFVRKKLELNYQCTISINMCKIELEDFSTGMNHKHLQNRESKRRHSSVAGLKLGARHHVSQANHHENSV